MSIFETWKYFYNQDFCTKETLQLLVQLGTLTQDQYNEIIVSKPDLTGRVIEPIPKGTSTQSTPITINTTKQDTAQG